MYIAQRQEQFSGAYLRAIAAVAGFSLSQPSVDDDSIDFIIASRGNTGIFRAPRLEVQLKCQMADEAVGEDGFSYPLKLKNYDDLRSMNVLVPRILIVVLVPPVTDVLPEWLVHSNTQTIFRCSGYWSSLYGQPPTNNQTTVSVKIMSQNLLTVDSLTELMQLVANGEKP